MSSQLSPNVFIRVGKESSKDIDGQDSQTTLRLYVHDGEHGLVEDGVAHILGGVCVSGNL